jgi:hypothetical protein
VKEVAYQLGAGGSCEQRTWPPPLLLRKMKLHGTWRDPGCLWGGTSAQWASEKCHCLQEPPQSGSRRVPWCSILGYRLLIRTWGKNGGELHKMSRIVVKR